MISPSPEQNHLLAALPQAVKTRIFGYLRPVQLTIGDRLLRSGDLVANVYFPTDMIVVLLGTTTSGESTEVAIVGNEGVAGITAFLGGNSNIGDAVVQSTGSAFIMRAKHVLDEFNRHGELHRRILRYFQALLTQVTQTAVCNRRHSIEQQLCRWLLSCLDRLPSNEIAMTQERIASMLGVRREGVTEAAGKLQRLGLIEYSRGHICVKNRQELERITCECYRLVKAETDRLLS